MPYVYGLMFVAFCAFCLFGFLFLVKTWTESAQREARELEELRLSAERHTTEQKERE